MNTATGRRSAIRTTITLIILLACSFGFGCQDVATSWEEAWSPDGLWLDAARSQQWGGPGTAYDATSAYLKWVKGSQPPVLVMAFSHQYATMNLKMNWLTPTHLEVAYGPSAKPADHVTLDFQAIKCGGIDISVRDLSKDTANPSHK
jgi:hypothetical protein